MTEWRAYSLNPPPTQRRSDRMREASTTTDDSRYLSEVEMQKLVFPIILILNKWGLPYKTQSTSLEWCLPVFTAYDLAVDWVNSLEAESVDGFSPEPIRSAESLLPCIFNAEQQGCTITWWNPRPEELGPVRGQSEELNFLGSRVFDREWIAKKSEEN